MLRVYEANTSTNSLTFKSRAVYSVKSLTAKDCWEDDDEEEMGASTGADGPSDVIGGAATGAGVNGAVQSDVPPMDPLSASSLPPSPPTQSQQQQQQRQQQNQHALPPLSVEEIAEARAEAEAREATPAYQRMLEFRRKLPSFTMREEVGQITTGIWRCRQSNII